MDYGFAPGRTSDDRHVRLFFQRRPETTLIPAGKTRTSVRDFINHLDTAASVSKPVGNLLLGAHAALVGALDDSKYRDTDTTGKFDADHPYPEYVRWGYSSKQDFLDGHIWSFSVKGRLLICRGRVYAYTMIVPVTSRAAGSEGNVIFNFYPYAGSGLSPVTDGLVETDSSLFATV